MTGNQGAGPEAIQFHYDLSNNFFSLWLDPGMFYSCALWTTGAEDLAQAQREKMRWYLDRADVTSSDSILDIGCGWGGALREALRVNPRLFHRGITLSQAQLEYCRSADGGKLNVDFEDWCDLATDRRYDTIVSIEAFEAFAHPDLTKQERIAVYRRFFETCHRLLNDHGHLCLQTIYLETAKGVTSPDFLEKHIFPDSRLPELPEIFAASEGLFTLDSAENAAWDYYLTCREWQRRLRAQKHFITERYGTRRYEHFNIYLGMSLIGFHQNNAGLLRLVLKKA